MSYIAGMIIWYLILVGILLFYIVYGIVKTLKNRSLTVLHKVIWVAIIIFLPVLGTSAYLRTMFVPRS
ncbi:MAG: hypothetical protein EOO20_15435 [Chryseobacterium sp.]|nr:MAG: hypothetical protein EOO20_15435 [Chryseobacterium sp.]